jgi:hypothetical protein
MMMTKKAMSDAAMKKKSREFAEKLEQVSVRSLVCTPDKTQCLKIN